MLSLPKVEGGVLVTGQHPRPVTDACRIPSCPRGISARGLGPGHSGASEGRSRADPRALLAFPAASSSAWAMAVPNPVIKILQKL